MSNDRPVHSSNHATRWALAFGVTAGWGVFLLLWQRLAAQHWAGSSGLIGVACGWLCFVSILAGLLSFAHFGVRPVEAATVSLFWASVYAALCLARSPGLFVSIAFDLFLFGVGATGGLLLAGLVEQARYLLPVVIVISFADTWSVFAGPSKTLAHPEVAPAVTVSLPQPGSGEFKPAVGITDVLFVAFFLAAAARFGMSIWLGAIGIAGGILIALLLLNLGKSIPGLPFIAGGFLIAQWPHMKPHRRELGVTFVFVAVMLLLMFIIAMLKRTLS